MKKNNFAKIEQIINVAKKGGMFILVDDEKRENEGDLIISTSDTNSKNINFMAKYGRGLICLALDSVQAKKLNLSLMSPINQSRNKTAFTISIEAKKGITTGISAKDRAKTIRVASKKNVKKNEIVSPGHVFPLTAREGGVLVRAGHTEAAVDITRIAGLNPASVICEIMKDDGTMARLNDLIPFCKKHNLKIGSIADLIRYRVNNDPIIKRKNNNLLSTKSYGDWNIFSYENTVNKNGPEHLALVKGELNNISSVLVRVHISNFINDAFDGVIGNFEDNGYISLKESMSEINKNGSGLIVVINYQDSSHILSNYINGNNIWNEEDKIRANGIGAQIIRDQGVKEMILLTNTEWKFIGLEAYGIDIIETKLLSEL